MKNNQQMTLGKNLVGKVSGCTTVIHLDNKKKITEFFVKLNTTNKIKKMQIYGKHDLLIAPNKVHIDYKTNSIKENWVNYYFILDERNTPIYTEACD